MLFFIELRNTGARLRNFQFYPVGPRERHAVRSQIVITGKTEAETPGFSIVDDNGQKHPTLFFL